MIKDIIIKFKKDLKEQQAQLKAVIKKAKVELTCLNMFKDKEVYEITEYMVKQLEKNSEIINNILGIEQLLESIKAIKPKKKDKKNFKKTINDAYTYLSNFIKHMESDYSSTQTLINAFENEKIKDPINNLQNLYHALKRTSLTPKESSHILGIAILFNSQYDKKNKNNNITNINIINQLAEYYNKDGTYKYIENVDEFSHLLYTLFEDDIISLLFYKILGNNKIQKISIPTLIDMAEKSNELLKNNINLEEQSTKNKELTNNYAISIETRNALQQLKKYYKNGTIIEIPTDLEEFNKLLDDCKLDDKEKTFILSLIDNAITNQKADILSQYLTNEQIQIYQESVTLLDSLTYSHPDSYILKQYLEELQIILNLLETETNKENQEYLLSDIPDIIKNLSIICQIHHTKNIETSNNYIFLLNKNGIPYIYEDINSVEHIYQKSICSLIPKINSLNKSQFHKVLTNEPYPYTIYEVNNATRGHVAFIEIDEGIYIIMGANIPRTGYKDFINRLKANINIIANIEKIIKNPDTRINLLKQNEHILLSLTQDSDTNTKKRKLTI